MLKKLIQSAFRPATASDGAASVGQDRAEAQRSSWPSLPAEPPPRVSPRWTYSADGFATTHNAAFLADPRFQLAYQTGVDSGHRICAPENLHIEWRVYVCCWAAEQALRLSGDFVECGVSTGIVSRAVASYIDFRRCKDRRFWLIDTFEGIPIDQASDAERQLSISKNARHYFDCSADVQAHFASMPDVKVIKGRVPDVLPGLAIGPVAYLHIDMNIAAPEVAASAHFWDKLVRGGLIVYDDYASLAHVEQKIALDKFAQSRGVAILSMPTGQGLLVKT
jgi:hypothetical protein